MCVSVTISLFIITVRDPDKYRFRTVPIPFDFFDAPHSSNAEIITFNSSDTGLPTMSWYFCVYCNIKRVIKQTEYYLGWHQPLSTENHLSIVSRLYSPK